MQVNITIETEKYKTVEFSNIIIDLKNRYIGQFQMLNTLNITVREHPLVDLKNYQLFIHRYNSLTKTCRLRISIYPGSDPAAFSIAVENCFQKLLSILRQTSSG